MCLLLLALDTVPGIPRLLLGNRDEFHARASAAVAPWVENAHVAGGRDLVAGGSWLALRDDGRFAAVTNLRTGVPATAPRSRGWLVRDFVLGEQPAAEYLADARAAEADYGPFNLIVGDRDGVHTLGSSDRMIRPLAAGVHVISNGPIGVHWPKTERLQRGFAEALDAGGGDAEARLLDLLLDEAPPPENQLPETGVGAELERVLAPVFIRGERYGTRAATLALCRAEGTTILRERRFGPLATVLGETRWQASVGDGFVETARA